MRVWAVLAVCTAASGALGAALYQDVASDVGLVHTVGPGVQFPQLSFVNKMLQRITGNGAAVGDYDGDGDLDVYLLGQAGEANVLFRNDLDSGVPGFTDVTATAGVGDTGLSRTAHFADLDNDGDLDLLVLNDDDGSGGPTPSRVYRNDGGVFADVTAGSGFDPIGYLRCGMSLADYDRDGLLDVYVTNWRFDPGWNRLYRNLGGLTFQDVTTAAGLIDLDQDSYSAIFHDFDGDLWPDLFVAVDHQSDEFWWNDGGTFTYATTSVGATHTGNDMGVAAADFDDDDDLDLYVTNITDPAGVFGTTQYNALHLSVPDGMGRIVFDEQAVAHGVGNTYWGWGVEFTDAENDGDLDIVAVTGFDEYVELVTGTFSPVYGTPAVFFENDGAGAFARVTPVGLESPDDSRALVAFDYDRDGDEDLLVTNVGDPARLYENVTPATGHWLSLEFEQAAGANRRGVGVVALAELPGRTLRRDLVAGDSFLAGTPAEVHLGLGAIERVPTLRVRWTDGSESVWNDLEADRHVRVIQGVADADLDAVTDPSDNCPTRVNPDQANGDADGAGDACDCATGDSTLWSAPGDPGPLELDGGAATTLSWGAAAPGGAAAPTYDLLRSDNPTYVGALCLEAGSGGLVATDPEPVAAGQVRFYRARATNACGATPPGLPECP